jgi:large repetitive protein
MEQIRYHKEIFAFAPAFSGAVDVDETNLSPIAAKRSTKRQTNGCLRAGNTHVVALLLFLLPFVCAATGTSAPALSYALTTTAGPVQPGQGIQFTVTVTNLSSATQSVTLNYDVPQFTESSGFAAGTGLTYYMGDVAVGATQVVSLDFTVLSGTQAPPDGSVINLVVSDQARAASVSCRATVRTVPAVVLELSTPQSPVSSGESFSYSLAYHNGGTTALSNAQLSLPVPAGASFISADGGGVLSSDGVVQWTLSSVAAGATGVVNVNLKAPSSTDARAPLVVEAALSDNAGQILAQASDAKAYYVTPALAYALTTTANPVQPGQGIEFTVTVTNLSSATQTVTLNYDVPQFTESSGFAAGTGLTYYMGNVAAGATQVVSLDFTVLSGVQAPPDGSLITAVVSDRAHGALVSCSATVRSEPAAVLELSTAQSPVTSGASFSYSLAYHNGATTALSNAQLSLPVPAGASFISADGGGVLGSDGVVRWTLSSVAAGASGEVNINLKAPNSTNAPAPLVVEAALRNSVGQILAQASDAKAYYVTPVLAYALTTTANPVQPGQGIQFTVTVTNLSSATQTVTLNYDVPQFTESSGFAAGTGLSYYLGNVAAGATQVVSLDFTVLSGAQAPSDGSLITAVVSDRAHGALVSCSATVRSEPAAVLELSTAQSPVTSGESFYYSLAYHNGGATALSKAQLSLPVPVGASFISADEGGVLGSDGVVRWALSSVAAGASGEVNINLKAPNSTNAQAPLVVEAAFRNSAGQILAQASDAKAYYVTPALAYALTTTANPVQPGQGIEFTVTVTNLSSATQTVTLNYDVPQFTESSGFAAGTGLTYYMGNVAAGATQVVSLDFTVLSGAQAPPDGSLITAVVSDRAHGALVSCSATVRSEPAAVLELSTAESPVTSGESFSYSLAYHNGGATALSKAQLSLPVPADARFISASRGGVLGSDGVVRWTLSSVAKEATGEVNVSLKAPSTDDAHAPLVVEAALRNSAGQILAQASDAKAYYVTPALAYALTTANPVEPGQKIQFTVTITNLSSAIQTVTLNYDVPQFTTDSGFVAGTGLTYYVGNVAAGATEVVSLDFTVLSGSQAPPAGSLITLLVSDRAHGAVVSQSVTVQK